MKINSQLFVKTYLDETFCISKLIVLREKIIIIKEEMESQIEVAHSLSDCSSIETLKEDIYFVTKNLRTVDVVINNKRNEVIVVGDFHNNCLN